MLHEFLSSNRTELIERCRFKAAQRVAPESIKGELPHGIPVFIDQIISTLRMEQNLDQIQSRIISGPAGGGGSVTSEIGSAARLRAHELLQDGYTLDRVVHDYGDLCQAITDLAVEDGVPILVDEFRTLNRCLDNAIADSVTAFASEHEQLMTARDAAAFHEGLGVFAHELRNLVTTATYTVTAIRTGQVGLSGPTGAVLDRCLSGLRNLADRSMAGVRLEAQMPAHEQLIGLAAFMAEVEGAATLEARVRKCVLKVAPIDPSLAVSADRDLLFSAVSNLLQNAFKFTAPYTEVLVSAYPNADRILIDVEDSCGGLPQGDPERLFVPFTQNGKDRSGLGLGLSIGRRNIEASHGVLRGRDIPGKGCVFTIDLPRHSLAEAP